MAAISPIFGVPYLEELRIPDEMEELGSEIDELKIAGAVEGEDTSRKVQGDSVCNRCLKVAAKKCANCETVRYCSRECQRRDWKEHKRICESNKRK